MNYINLTYTSKNWYSYQNLLKYYIYLGETYYENDI